MKCKICGQDTSQIHICGGSVPLSNLPDDQMTAGILTFPANYGTNKHPCRVPPPPDPQPAQEGIWPPGAGQLPNDIS